MSDEVHITREVEVTHSTVTEDVVIADSEPLVDVQSPPEPADADAADAAYVAEPAVVYPAARGAWDFTDTQRIILALLLWLNLMILGLGYMAITGRL